MEFFVYAIYNREVKKIYIGQTEDLVRRLQEHNGELENPSKYTKRYPGKWVVIYSEKCKNRTAALLREKQLKSYQGRLFIKKHIPT